MVEAGSSCAYRGAADLEARGASGLDRVTAGA